VNEGITLPAWLFFPVAILAIWAAAEHLLLPTLRKIARWRAEAVLNELGSKFHLQIPQFKLARRQALIERLYHDDKIQAAVQRCVEETGISPKEARGRADRYAREIVPSFNAYLYFRIGYWLAKIIARSLYRVRVGYADEQALSEVDPKSTVVFVINHRSNFDYVLVAFLAAERAALSYAVGEWARIWPLQTLIRSMGAYFVRRNSGDPLYRSVLQRYVQLATEAGVTQAVFPEGGLSIDGAMRTPKLGLIDYIVRGFDPRGGRDVVFIPVAVNYDRVLEDRTLLRKLDPHPAPVALGGALRNTLAFVLSQLGLRMVGRWYRFGYACVNFGTPLSLREQSQGRDWRLLSDAQRQEQVQALGAKLVARIQSVMPVLPVALVAKVLLENSQRSLSALELKGLAYEMQGRLAAAGAHVYIPRGDQDYAIETGLRMLVLRHFVGEENGMFRIVPQNRQLLAYYANSIAHFFAHHE
jgi:glycerol-3-phosphate O-acyltransferase